MQKAKTAAAIATVVGAGIIGGGKADAAVLTDDLNPNPSTAIVTFAAPTGVQFTGGDGVGEGKYVATSSDKIFLYDGANITPSMTFTTPLSGITGFAYTGRDNGTITGAVSDGTSLYEGTLSGGNFNIDNVIGLTGISSDTTDVTFGLGSYFVPTQSDGVRRVESDGSTTLTFNANGVESYDILESKLDGSNNPVYTNPADQVDGDLFNNTDNGGVHVTGSTAIDLNNATTIRGIAYFDSDTNPLNGVDGGLAVIQGPGIQIHNPLDYQQNIVDVGTPIPEPMSITMGLVGLGGLALMRRRKDYQTKE
jgi:uncharacterized protein (TIGR03382 family)